MKNFSKGIFFSLMPLTSFAADVVNTCQLGHERAHVIQVAREHEIAASHSYSLRYGTTTQYFFGSPDTSRALSVQIFCAGKKQHALVAYGEFTSNFLQGFVIVRGTPGGMLHRLDFAERSPPQWIYLGNDETLAIMPTHGRGEYGGRKYIVYRRANRDGAETDVSGSDVLPPADGFEVVPLTGEPRH